MDCCRSLNLINYNLDRNSRYFRLFRWKALRSDFARGNNELRCFTLDMLKDAAHYQPAQTLESVEFAIRHPVKEMPSDSSRDLTSLYTLTYQSILRRLPTLLQSISLHIRPWFERAKLNGSQTRPLHHFSNHPCLRFLSSAAIPHSR